MSDHFTPSEHEVKSVPELQLYSDLLNLALSQFNVDLLVVLWKDSLTLDKTSLKEINSLILEKLPSLVEHFGLEEEVTSFPEFVREYDEYIYNKECVGTPSKCIAKFARRGDIRNVKKALEKGAIYLSDASYEASKIGRKDIVQLLYLHDGLVLSSALEGAARGGHAELVKWLVRKYSVSFDRALYQAARSKNPKLTEYFVKKGANEKYILFGVAKSGSFNVFKKVYKKYKDKTYAEEILPYAILGKSLDKVKFLVEKGYVNFDEALIKAVFTGYLPTVKFFVELGASDFDAALYNSTYNNQVEVVEYILTRRSFELSNVLLLAVRMGYLEIVKLFIEKGVDRCDEAFTLAIELDNLRILKYFLANGCGTMNEGLLQAYDLSKYDVAEIFLQEGADNIEEVYDLALESRDKIMTKLLEKYR